MSRTFSREDLNDEVLVPRLQRENAKTGAITASLLWNGKSDLDLHCFFTSPATGKVHIYYRHKIACGGELDVDANARDGDAVEEPVENIYWKAPQAGSYELQVNCYAMRGTTEAIPFRVQLKLPQEILDYEGTLASRGASVTVFKFNVNAAGEVTVGKIEPKRVMRKPSAAILGGGAAPKAKAKAKGKAKAAPKMAAAMKAMKVMKAMKPMKAMKAMKAMKKVMKPSIIARGKRAKVQVYSGKKVKTSGGTTKDMLMRNKAGDIVSKRMSLAAKKRYPTTIKPWVEATKKARTALGITGFVAMKKGSEFYKKTKEFYDAA